MSVFYRILENKQVLIYSTDRENRSVILRVTHEGGTVSFPGAELDGTYVEGGNARVIEIVLQDVQIISRACS